MMKMQKKWIGLLLAVVLVMMMGAASAAALQPINVHFDLAMDEYGLINYQRVNLLDALQNNSSEQAQEIMNSLFVDYNGSGDLTMADNKKASAFEYKWTLSSEAMQWNGINFLKHGIEPIFNWPDTYSEAYAQFDNFPGYKVKQYFENNNARPLVTLTILENGVEKFYICYFVRNVQEDITINENLPETTYVYSDQNTYTFTLDDANYTIPERYTAANGYTITYNWKANNERIVGTNQLAGDRNGRTNVPYIVVDDLAQVYGKRLKCSIVIEGNGDPIEKSYHSAFVLQNSSNPCVIMPEQSEPEAIDATIGQTVTLTVPAAKASNSAAIEYRWYEVVGTAQGPKHQYLATTATPSYTVPAYSATGPHMYKCKVAFVNGADEYEYGYVHFVNVQAAGTAYYEVSGQGSTARRNVVEPNLNAVPDTMDNRYNLSTMTADMRSKMTASNQTLGAANALYDISYQQHAIAFDSKESESPVYSAEWSGVSAGLFPTKGVEFTIPYPAGTDENTEFSASHIFASEGGDFAVGEIEVLEIVKKTADGVVVKVHGTSPVLLTYTPAAPASGSAPSVPTTGDNTPIALLCALLLLSAVGVYGMSRKRSA